MFTQVRTSMNDFREITGDLKIITHRIRTGEGTVGKVFTNPAMAQNVGQAVVSFQEGAEQFKEVMESAKHSWVLWGFGKDKEKEKEKGREAPVAPLKP
jgi:hypothetical protein